MDNMQGDNFSLETEKLPFFNTDSEEFKRKLEKIRSKELVYKSTFAETKIPISLTFNDVLMVPQYS